MRQTPDLRGQIYGDCNDCAPLVVLLVHEAFQRTETSVHDELQVAQMSLGKGERGQIVRLCEKRISLASIPQMEIFQDAVLAVRCVGHGCWVELQISERLKSGVGQSVATSSLQK